MNSLIAKSTGQELENLECVCYSYSIKQILNLYEQKIGFEGKSNDSILEAIKKDEIKLRLSLQFEDERILMNRIVLYCRNFTKYEMMKSYDGSVTAENIDEWRVCMSNLESRIEQIKNTVRNPKKLDAQQKPIDAVE